MAWRRELLEVGAMVATAFALGGSVGLWLTQLVHCHRNRGHRNRAAAAVGLDAVLFRCEKVLSGEYPAGIFCGLPPHCSFDCFAPCHLPSSLSGADQMVLADASPGLAGARQVKVDPGSSPG
jgi:hypothetical protein